MMPSASGSPPLLFPFKPSSFLKRQGSPQRVGKSTQSKPISEGSSTNPPLPTGTEDIKKSETIQVKQSEVNHGSKAQRSQSTQKKKKEDIKLIEAKVFSNGSKWRPQVTNP
jgi:hypothetical protein